MPKYIFVGASVSANGRDIDRFGTALEIDDKELIHWNGVHLLPEADYAKLGIDEAALKRWPTEADRARVLKSPEDQAALAALVAKVSEARKAASEFESRRNNVNADWVDTVAAGIKKGGGK